MARVIRIGGLLSTMNERVKLAVRRRILRRSRSAPTNSQSTAIFPLGCTRPQEHAGALPGKKSHNATTQNWDLSHWLKNVLLKYFFFGYDSYKSRSRVSWGPMVNYRHFTTSFWCLFFCGFFFEILIPWFNGIMVHEVSRFFSRGGSWSFFSSDFSWQ